MTTSNHQCSTQIKRLTWAWVVLMLLTVISLYLGQWLHGTSGLQIMVAGIIWLKSALVAERFIGMSGVHPFIRFVVHGFVAATPVLLMIVAYFGQEIVNWVTLAP